VLDSSAIRERSLELGFTACGFARAEPLPMEEILDSWLGKSFHGQLNYMAENRDLRLDPNLLFPGVKTVIPLLASYYKEAYTPSDDLKISRYAVGRDYHKVLKKRGQKLIDWMSEKVPGGIIDANKCISYLTIELKENISREFKGQTDNWLFGCDRCQEVCPHNRFAKESDIQDFEPRAIIKGITEQVINLLDQKGFSEEFSGTALKRAGLEKLQKTVSFLYPGDK